MLIVFSTCCERKEYSLLYIYCIPIKSRALFLYGVMIFPSLLLSIGLLLLSATFCFNLDRTFRLGSDARKIMNTCFFFPVTLNSHYFHTKEWINCKITSVYNSYFYSVKWYAFIQPGCKELHQRQHERHKIGEQKKKYRDSVKKKRLCCHALTYNKFSLSKIQSWFWMN